MCQIHSRHSQPSICRDGVLHFQKCKKISTATLRVLSKGCLASAVLSYCEHRFAPLKWITQDYHSVFNNNAFVPILLPQ